MPSCFWRTNCKYSSKIFSTESGQALGQGRVEFPSLEVLKNCSVQELSCIPRSGRSFPAWRILWFQLPSPKLFRLEIKTWQRWQCKGFPSYFHFNTEDSPTTSLCLSVVNCAKFSFSFWFFIAPLKEHKVLFQSCKQSHTWLSVGHMFASPPLHPQQKFRAGNFLCWSAICSAKIHFITWQQYKKNPTLGYSIQTMWWLKPSFPFISTQTLLIPPQESAGCCLVAFLTIQSAKWQQGTDRLQHHLRTSQERAEHLKGVLMSQGFETLVNNANFMQQICIPCIQGCLPGTERSCNLKLMRCQHASHQEYSTPSPIFASLFTFHFKWEAPLKQK